MHLEQTDGLVRPPLPKRHEDLGSLGEDDLAAISAEHGKAEPLRPALRRANERSPTFRSAELARTTGIPARRISRTVPAAPGNGRTSREKRARNSLVSVAPSASLTKWWAAGGRKSRSSSAPPFPKWIRIAEGRTRSPNARSARLQAREWASLESIRQPSRSSGTAPKRIRSIRENRTPRLPGAVDALDGVTLQTTGRP